MKRSLVTLTALALAVAVQAAEVRFARAGVALTPPDDWVYNEEGTKVFLLNPDKAGKIQAFVTQLPKVPLTNVVQAYYDATFKDATSPRPGHPVVILEQGEFVTAGGVKGVKGAFGYAQGTNGGPEVWTWRYFFPRADGKYVSVCSYVYGDSDRAKTQEAIIAETLQFAP